MQIEMISVYNALCSLVLLTSVIPVGK